MDKNTIETGVVKAEENDVELRSRSKLAGTEADRHDMRVLGKRPVECERVRRQCVGQVYATNTVRRNFRFISILALSCTAMSTWEITLASAPSQVPASIQ